jgi:hypothetical protein
MVPVSDIIIDPALFSPVEVTEDDNEEEERAIRRWTL